ncbi:hypothetical protein HQ531_08745 [bacterium]|nr:hypothetical protein [bacterium]
MNLRIQTLLDNAEVQRFNTEIWILLYPPEIHTSSIYVPSHATRKEINGQIRDEVFPKLPYSLNYDWNNFSLQRRDNGYGQDMVTITVLGKEVLPRIKALLYKNSARVNFVGDGLQFLNVDETQFPQVRGQTYEVILPYDEVYYRADFRSGVHIESCGLPHAGTSDFGQYKLKSQQVYLKFDYNGTIIDLPLFQPIVPKVEWMEALLTPAAFPTWYVARNSMRKNGSVNFVHQFQSIDGNNM